MGSEMCIRDRAVAVAEDEVAAEVLARLYFQATAETDLVGLGASECWGQSEAKNWLAATLAALAALCGGTLRKEAVQTDRPDPEGNPNLHSALYSLVPLGSVVQQSKLRWTRSS